jgi:RimJ/RimL family protein N-acetyltransferase
MAGFGPRDRDAFMDHWTTRVLGDEDVMAQTVLVDGVVAGNVVSFRSPVAPRREVGYWIGREFWGRGVATAALRRFLERERTRPIYAGVVTHNLGSIRVLEKCGFLLVEEGASPGSRDDALEEVLLRLDDPPRLGSGSDSSPTSSRRLRSTQPRSRASTTPGSPMHPDVQSNARSSLVIS